jgi:hypothetical protein
MARTIAILGVRFAVIAALYMIVVAIWVDNAKGWDSLSVLGAGVAFGVAAIPSWCGAIVIGLKYIADRRRRLVAHPALTAMIFIVIVYVAMVGFDYATVSSMWRETWPFAALIMIVAAADALVGLLLEWWKPPQTERAA